MYESTSFTNSPFGLFAVSRTNDASRLLNNIELLVEDVEEHLAQVGNSGIAGFAPASISDMADATEAAREIVSMIKSEQLTTEMP